MHFDIICTFEDSELTIIRNLIDDISIRWWLQNSLNFYFWFHFPCLHQIHLRLLDLNIPFKVSRIHIDED